MVTLVCLLKATTRAAIDELNQGDGFCASPDDTDDGGMVRSHLKLVSVIQCLLSLA